VAVLDAAWFNLIVCRGDFHQSTALDLEVALGVHDFDHEIHITLVFLFLGSAWQTDCVNSPLGLVV